MDKKLRFEIFWKTLFIQSGWNFFGLQNFGFLFSIMPALKKIHKNKKDLAEAALRHSKYFNTNPYMAGFITGLCIKLEEEAALKQNINEKTEIYSKIDALKNSMTTAAAAIGDRFFWANLKPFCFAIVLLIATCVISFNIPCDRGIVIFAVIPGFVIYNLAAVFIRWKSLKHGYSCTCQKYCGIDYLNWNKLIKVLKMAGVFILIFLAVPVLIKSYDLLKYYNITESRLLFSSVASVIFTIALFFKRKISAVFLYFGVFLAALVFSAFGIYLF